jgi:hypothetical protein
MMFYNKKVKQLASLFLFVFTGLAALSVITGGASCPAA